MANPFDQFDIVPAPRLPQVIDGPPREPPPQTATSAALDEQQLENARLEARAKKLAIDKAEREAANGGEDKNAAARKPKLEALGYQIADVYDQYNRKLAGKGLLSVGEYLPTDANQTFDTAAAGLGELAMSAFRVPGVGSQSDAELKTFIQANRPSAWDQDGVVEQKLRNILTRLNAERTALGLDPLDEKDMLAKGTPAGAGPLKVTVTADAPASGGTPPSDPNGDPSLLDQLGSSTVNTIAGYGQGLAGIPDAATNALGAVMGVGGRVVSNGLDAVGLDGAAENLRWAANQWDHPITIGGSIERAAPTPQDGVGRGVRIASQFAGGAAGMPASAVSALTERVAGGVPSAFGRAAPSASAFSAPTPSMAEDASALGIRSILPADAGGPLTRGLSAISAQTPIGGALIARRAGKFVDEAGRALRKIAGREGQVTNSEAAGETAVAGALKYRSTSRNQIGALYDKAAELARGIKVLPERTIQALDQNIAQLAENPASADDLPYLTTLRDTLVKKFPDGVTVEGIRGMRTSLRDKFFRDGLRGSDIERRVNEAVQSVSDDLADSLTSAGKSEAASLYRQADAAWADRIKTLDDFIMPIIGKKGEKSGQQVMQALQQAAKSNGPKVRNFINSLPEEGAASTRANLIMGMARANPGAQGAEGTTLSLETMLSRWSEMGERAKGAFFTDENRSAFDRLARIAERSRASRKYANSSNTGRVSMGALMGAGGVTLGWSTLASSLAVDAGFGILLSSPRVATALARVGAAESPAEVSGAVSKLSLAVARNPALAGQITQLQTRLMAALNDNVSTGIKAAASEPSGPDRRQE